MCLAAQAHSVPVLVVGNMYKLTPRYPFDYMTYNELLSPGLVFQFEEADAKENISVVVPGYDYIEPELLSLYITNYGAQTPNYIYRLFADHYSHEDLHEEDEEE